MAKWWCICCVYMLCFLHFCCQGGEMVVRRWWLGFAISAEIHCVTAVAWCVSGVSNHDFPNFTKHSTVLTSILQQINTLYQHFQSAKTALPALEQAKTMLKIALPTFKNDENHTQNSKIHIQNSVCEVRCGKILCENGKMYAVFGGFMIDCGMFCRCCGGFYVLFRRLQCLFAVKMQCGNGRIWCENGENAVLNGKMVVQFRHVLSWLRRFLCVIQMIARFIYGENAVRKRQNCGVFAACTCLISCIFVAKVAKWWCDCGGLWCGCGVFVFGFFMI